MHPLASLHASPGGACTPGWEPRIYTIIVYIIFSFYQIFRPGSARKVVKNARPGSKSSQECPARLEK